MTTATTIDRLFVAVLLLESVACTVKVKVPDDEGAPLIVPDELRLSPDGKLPEVISQV
jgi:hypothetical protein